MKNAMNNNTKLILLQPSLHKQNSFFFSSSSRIFLIFIITFFSFASFFTFISSNNRASQSNPKPDPRFPQTSLPLPIYDSLLHYATASASAGSMSAADLKSIASLLRRRSPSNLLIFGLGPETLLWKSINHGGRTVILDENEYYIKHFEDKHPNIEAYDVAYSTKVKEADELISEAKSKVDGDCRPIQNLLFSECRLAINDLPNELYEVDWDVIIVDGPRGYSEESPGRMAAIFTAAVMSRRGKGKTDVIVHDFEREVERRYSEEFLCGENLVKGEGQVGHFVVHGGGGGGEQFCANRSVGLPPAAVSKS